MTTRTIPQTRIDTQLPVIVSAIVAGALLIFVAGFAQASAAHDSAHDTRHAVAFPCH